MSDLNKIYEKQYLKSVGKDDASLKRKRQEDLDYLDEYVEEMKESVMKKREIQSFKKHRIEYCHRESSSLANQARHEYREKKRARAKLLLKKDASKYLNNDECVRFKRDLQEGYDADDCVIGQEGIAKALPDAEKELSEELGTEDEYVESHVTENAHVQLPLGVIMAIRDLIKNTY